MRIVLAASLVSMALGFFVGKKSTDDTESREERSVVLSEQKFLRSGSQRKRPTSQGTSADQFQRLIENLEVFPEDSVALAKLHGWILGLEEHEIPDALELILEREKENDGSVGSDGELSRTPVGKEVLLLLSRWYELSGESALSWIRDQENWSPGKSLQTEILAITDGYHRDPAGSFQRCLEFLQRTKKVELWNDHVFCDVILYQVGRWGSDPIAQLDQIDPDGYLQGVVKHPGVIGGGSFSGAPSGLFPANPASFPNPVYRALAEGLVNSGRIGIAKKMLSKLEDGALSEFEAVVVREAQAIGWQETKRLIDAKELSGAVEEIMGVLNKMAQQDRKDKVNRPETLGGIWRRLPFRGRILKK